MRTSAGITATSASVMSLAEQPGAAALLDLGVHALIGAAQPGERRVHLLLGKAGAAHGQHELAAQRLQLREREELLALIGGKARQEGEVEGRHPHRRRRHLVDETHQRPHVGALDRIVAA